MMEGEVKFWRGDRYPISFSSFACQPTCFAHLFLVLLLYLPRVSISLVTCHVLMPEYSGIFISLEEP